MPMRAISAESAEQMMLVLASWLLEVASVEAEEDGAVLAAVACTSMKVSAVGLIISSTAGAEGAASA